MQSYEPKRPNVSIKHGRHCKVYLEALFLNWIWEYLLKASHNYVLIWCRIIFRKPSCWKHDGQILWSALMKTDVKCLLSAWTGPKSLGIDWQVCPCRCRWRYPTCTLTPNRFPLFVTVALDVIVYIPVSVHFYATGFDLSFFSPPWF